MKKVQEYFKEVNEEELIDSYFYDHPIEYEKEYFMDKTVESIRENAKSRVRDYIERLRTLPIEASEDGKIGIFLVHKIPASIDSNAFNAYCLVHMDELFSEGKAESYAYEFCRQEEILGWYIADNPYTQENLTDLLVDIMWEASFFGFEQEELESEKATLDEAIKEIEEGKGTSHPIEELFGDDWARFREKDEKTKEFDRKIAEAVSDFYEYEFNKELNLIRKSIEESQFFR